MRKSKYTEEQIVAALKQADAGMKVEDVCLKLGVTQTTVYSWKAKFSGMDVSEAKRLKQLEDENRGLKEMVADQALDIRTVVAKNMVKSSVRRRAVGFLVDAFGASQRRVCKVIGIGRSSCRYTSTKEEPVGLLSDLRDLAVERPRFGYRRLHALLKRRGHRVNHKRVDRLYKAENLAVRRRKRKRIAAQVQTVPAPPQRPNERWSIDFVSDSLGNGRWFRALTVVDAFTRECLAIEVDTSLAGLRVVRALERIIAERGLSTTIFSDSGPEFTGAAMDQWAAERGIRQHFVRPGIPMENGYVESFNGKLRDECLSGNWFISLTDAKSKIEAWRRDFNFVRPHSSLDNQTPEEYSNTFIGVTLRMGQ